MTRPSPRRAACSQRSPAHDPADRQLRFVRAHARRVRAGAGARRAGAAERRALARRHRGTRPVAHHHLPGPRTPADAGISTAVVRRFGASVPTLGVCLGHQCIGAAYGGIITRAPRPVHGHASDIHHDGSGILAGLPSPFAAARYHSLVIDRATMPADLRVIAETADGVIMAVAHARHPVTGVQFHPESVLSRHGHHLLRNFLQPALALPGAVR